MIINKIYQLKVGLVESKPLIWRKILVHDQTLLPEFHHILQTTMGWDNAHLHQFSNRNIIYSPPDEYNELPYTDYRKIKLNKLLKHINDHIVYEYDFGDGWEHEIVLEEVLNKESPQIYPLCIDGKNACPPEDCGGIGGYQNLLTILSNPAHQEYDEWIEWLGGEFDPKVFNIEEVNKMLHSEDYGVISLWD